MSSKFIDVKGAREHNLKDVSVSIPKNKLTVITGLSGSGKSSLAFDTIYAEGQRRYMDSLSVYARHFLEQLKKPDVDSISGLSPAIAIDQKTISSSPRSTVGTVTEIYDYLRLLFAKVGTPRCPTHKVPVEGRLPEEIIEEIKSLPNGTKVIIYAPVAKEKKGEFTKEFKKWSKLGFVYALIDGKLTEIDESLKLAKTKRHNVDILVDKLKIDKKYGARLSESINKALSLANGRVSIDIDNQKTRSYSIHYACPVCGYSFNEIDPLIFSFNNPKGACEDCNGLGTRDIEEYDDEILTKGDTQTRVKQTRWKVTSKGENSEEDDYDREILRDCDTCGGTGLNQQALNIFIGENNIADLSALSIVKLKDFVSQIQMDKRQKLVAEKIIEELTYRLSYLVTSGASYLSLNRRSRTLSGGEAQRIRLASQVSTPLIGVLYVLDEPSIGLHPKDHKNVLKLLEEIRRRGNTVIVVEHDEDTIRAADHVIDIGPNAGVEGGFVISSTTPSQLVKNKESLTGQYLSKKKKFPYPDKRRVAEQFLKVRDASENNLKNINIDLPIGTFTVVSGVSGSGKSTLIMDTLLPYMINKVRKSQLSHGRVKNIEGFEHIERVVSINQKPIGRTPRSCPATYVGLFPMIRDLFAHLPESRMRGYKPGHFSFNVKGGRCEICQGAGQIKTSMHFLADSYVPCDTCNGRRYSSEMMLIKYKGKNIADVLEMPVSEAVVFFEKLPRIHKKLQFLNEVGLGYIRLGQNSKTLSGGEAQRIKLARELSKQSKLHTLYILDEPTTGLHIHDTARLSQILSRLVDHSNTVVVIEHNLDIINSADHVIDLGPEGGDSGGQVLFEGSPEILIKNKSSFTGKALREHLNS